MSTPACADTKRTMQMITGIRYESSEQQREVHKESTSSRRIRDYADAVSSYGSACTFNAALAKVLNDDAEGAMSTLDCSEDKESAIGFYLKAVIGAKMNDASAVIENLNSAIAQDPALKAKAAKDAAFHGVSGSAEFKAIVE